MGFNLWHTVHSALSIPYTYVISKHKHVIHMQITPIIQQNIILHIVDNLTQNYLCPWYIEPASKIITLWCKACLVALEQSTINNRQYNTNKST